MGSWVLGLGLGCVNVCVRGGGGLRGLLVEAKSPI